MALSSQDLEPPPNSGRFNIEWHFDQTSGQEISNLTQTLSNGNHTARFDFLTPTDTGSICFKVKVQNANHFYTDSASFCITVG